MTPMEKSSLLHKLADQIELHADALAHIETLNLGMPIGDAKGNALAGVSTLRYIVPLPTPPPALHLPLSFPFLFFFFFVSVVVFAFFLLSYYCIMRTCLFPKYP